jgi:hypothetical protein
VYTPGASAVIGRQAIIDCKGRGKRIVLSMSANPPNGRLGCFHFSLQETACLFLVIPQPAGWGYFTPTF